jgi:hypothetical protein
MSWTWKLVLVCLAALVITTVVTVAVIERQEASKAESEPPQVLPPAPADPPPAAAPPSPDLPWFEQVSFPPSGKRVVAAQFRYRGRYLDCWAVCEAGAYREVVPLTMTELASDLWRGHRSADPVEGRITVALALPADAAIRHCVFDLNLTAGGGGVGWARAVPCSPWWGRRSGTGDLGPDRKMPDPGQTVLLFEHLAENPVPVFESYLLNLHLEHDTAALEARGLGWRAARLADAVFRRRELATPAAWTAAWMVGLAGDGWTGLAAAFPYVGFIEDYYALVRLRVYARFLTDEEVKQVRAKADEPRKEDREWRNDLVPLIESFRRPPKG